MRPGYPKLISDVWGIEGPIDAAFTRINCQGKTYLFKVGRSLTAGLGVLLGRPVQPPNPPWPHPGTLHACTHTVVARYLQIPVAVQGPRQPQLHQRASQRLLAPLGRPAPGECCTQFPDPPSVPHSPRAVSTGALMTEPWTPGTHATSPRALKASRTTSMRPSPSPRTATTAMRESIFSRVRAAAQPGQNLAPATVGRTPLNYCSPSSTCPPLMPRSFSPRQVLLVL